MSAEFTTVLGRLLTDAPLRREFALDPEGTARRLGLDSVPEIDAEDLEAQAETLLEKRHHEVARLMPRTFARWGDAARARFLEYAACHWPTGHARHLQDAVEFGRHLGEDVDRGELNRLEFVLEGRRIGFYFVRAMSLGGRPRRAVQILYRRRGGPPRELALYLAV